MLVQPYLVGTFKVQKPGMVTWLSVRHANCNIRGDSSLTWSLVRYLQHKNMNNLLKRVLYRHVPSCHIPSFLKPIYKACRKDGFDCECLINITFVVHLMKYS
eukprot:TRINITY_DN30934_c0_g1_i1.p1 TRINITY_DN30934_c0_g1~~TRINITY_DN30934_c0_g1_i1.p1  ORF type:complete len:102 (+),score=5.42 TRINITY_DN30934_c0_g1_i1:229-534(+)